MTSTSIELTSTGQNLHLSLAINVTNCAQVRQKVISGQLNCVLIKPSLVPSCLVVATAANKACLSSSRGSMRTRSVNTEILFNMSSSSNITESLTKFGVGDTDTEILVASIDGDMETVRGAIAGDWVDTEHLETYLDTAALTKLHKLKTEELSDLTGALCSRISAKDAL